MKRMHKATFAAISLVLLGSVALAAPAAGPRGFGPGMMGQGMMGQGFMGGRGAMVDHVEGSLAFLKAELAITDAETGAWNEFADAFRANAQKLRDLRTSLPTGAGTGPTLERRLDLQERVLTVRLDNVRAIKAPATKLYAALSDDQKKRADQLLPAYISARGMMGMGMGGGMMGAGGFQMMGAGGVMGMRGFATGAP